MIRGEARELGTCCSPGGSRGTRFPARVGGPGLGSPPANPVKVCCLREDLSSAENRWQSCCWQHWLAPGAERDEGQVEAPLSSFAGEGGPS